MTIRNPIDILTRSAFVAAIALIISSCAAPDTQHHIVISTREQKLAVLDRSKLMAIYPVSTSKFGLGDWPGSSCTPLGKLEIAEKIGDVCNSVGTSRCDVRTARRAVPTLRQFAEMFSRSSVRKQFHVRVNHDADKLVESYRRFPIENLFGFGSVTDQVLNFCWPLITWVVFDEFFPIKIDM